MRKTRSQKNDIRAKFRGGDALTAIVTHGDIDCAGAIGPRCNTDGATHAPLQMLIRSCVAAPSALDLFQEQGFADLVATDEGLRGAELSEDVQDFAILKHARVNRERGGRN